MKLARMFFAFAMFTIPVFGEPSVDPRALKDCTDRDPAFTAISECLPAAHVGVMMLDFIAQANTFGESGNALADACMQINGHQLDATWACARRAIEQAVELGRMLPEGATISDNRFEPLNRPKLIAPILQAQAEARAQFKRGNYWPSTMYIPLK